jgi:GNAT superfamily N-acetyltransferase
MLAIAHITDFGAAFFYQNLTFPKYRRLLLNNGKLDTRTVAVGASESGQPIGLALAEIGQFGQQAKVLSIYVAPQHRRKGVGTALLTHLEEELASAGCTSATLQYMTDQESLAAFERLLQTCHWNPPQFQQLVCKCDRRTLTAPWLNMEFMLPPSFQIVPWEDITPDEKIWIQQSNQANSWIPPDLLPSIHEEDFEPLNSLGMRYQGRVIGWLITHRLAVDTIRYTCSYIRQDLQKAARIIPMYAEAVKRQKTAMPDSKAIWTVPKSHASMIAFVKKRLASYMVSLEEGRGSSKQLSRVEVLR